MLQIEKHAPSERHLVTGWDVLLRDLLHSYVADRPDLSPLSADQIRYTLNNYERFLHHAPRLADLAKSNLIVFCQTFKAAPTANKNRVNLISLWNHAADLELLPPPPRIAKRKEPIRAPVVFTLDEVRRLWLATDLLEGNWDGVPIRQAWKVAIAVLWDTAARVGTLLKAELSEVNLDAATWHVPAEHIKGGRADRVFRLHPDTVAVIKDSLTTRRLLFPFPYRKEAAERHLGKLLILADLPHGPKNKFHCLRRTAESYAAANMGIEAAAAAVGHSVAVAMKHYISNRIVQPPSLIDGLPRPF